MYITSDPFGLEKEAKIKKSGVRDVFTPYTPIESASLFAGRKTEVARIIEYLNTPGQHAVLYGERGVGKSSLANATADLLFKSKLVNRLFTKRCDSNDTFLSIFRDPLAAVGINVDEQAVAKSAKGVLSALGMGGEKASTRNSSGSSARATSPSWVASQIQGVDSLMIIDEFDLIKNLEDKEKIAELIKHLSDQKSKLKILIVGIAESAVELTTAHPSIQRCLKETRLARMSVQELRAIISAGEDRLQLRFSSTAASHIVNVSSGYPHFTHLLALKAAEDAIASERQLVGVEDVRNATSRAVDDAEGTLRTAYLSAIRSSNTEEYKKVLLAAALCSEEEIVAKELRAKYEELYSTELLQGSLSNYLLKLISTDGSKILRRVSKGVYRFTDPRMPSFIRIAQKYIPSLEVSGEEEEEEEE